MTEYTVKAYKDHLMNEELVGVECKSCGHLMLPPRPLCNKCGSTDSSGGDSTRERESSRRRR